MDKNSLHKHLRRYLFFGISDFILSIISLSVSVVLYYNSLVHLEHLKTTILTISISRTCLFWISGSYRSSWIYFGFKDIKKQIFLSLIISTLYAVYCGQEVPFVIFFNEFFLFLFLLLSHRVSKRLFYSVWSNDTNKLRTLIVSSPIEAKELTENILETTVYKPVAIWNEEFKGLTINGVNVKNFNQISKLSGTIEIGIVSEEYTNQKTIVDLTALGIKTIKKYTKFSNLNNKSNLEDISVEDLLARRPKDLDKSLIQEFINGKTILVTGAGGSIGSEICRHCKKYGAKKLLLLERSEFNLYAIVEELGDFNAVPIMKDVVDFETLGSVFKEHKPQVVIHAAAYKHVPLVESNMMEGIKNNVIGTKNIVDNCVKYEVEKLILISTDKAVRPTNVMGATKRICELYSQNVISKKTEIVAVRFGNVLGSSGSVIPKFKAQIQAGKNITVTHPDITRYFMLIPEACELVLQAGALGKGREIFILDMGEPIKIMDLAKKMIELSGRKDISIEICGLRPGEKLFEELLINESECFTEYESITIAPTTIYNIESLNNDIQKLISLKSKDEILVQLKNIVPEFSHKENK